jgi:hypothetical protein
MQCLLPSMLALPPAPRAVRVMGRQTAASQPEEGDCAMSWKWAILRVRRHGGARRRGIQGGVRSPVP